MKPKVSIFLRTTKEIKKQKKRITFFKNEYLYTFALDERNSYSPHTKKHYQVIPSQTEKQLCRFIYENICNGKQLSITILAHIGPRSFTLWRGIIGPEGYQMEEKKANEKDIIDIDKIFDTSEVDDELEKQAMELSAEEMKRDIRNEVRQKRYGLSPYVLSSGRRGEFHTWDEEDLGLIKKERRTSIKKKKFDEMSIDDLNGIA